MSQPPGFEASDKSLVCKLHRLSTSLNKLLGPGMSAYEISFFNLVLSQASVIAPCLSSMFMVHNCMHWFMLTTPS